jgi:hypothetical protein
VYVFVAFLSLFLVNCIAITSPDDTPWEGGTFKLTMSFTEEYPNKPPKVAFVTKLFHPNGIVCSGVCNCAWHLVGCVCVVRVCQCHRCIIASCWSCFDLFFLHPTPFCSSRLHIHVHVPPPPHPKQCMPTVEYVWTFCKTNGPLYTTLQLFLRRFRCPSRECVCLCVPTCM